MSTETAQTHTLYLDAAKKRSVTVVSQFLSPADADRIREWLKTIVVEPKPSLHRYEPHKKYPWFCKHCGYEEGHPLFHLPNK